MGSELMQQSLRSPVRSNAFLSHMQQNEHVRAHITYWGRGQILIMVSPPFRMQPQIF